MAALTKPAVYVVSNEGGTRESLATVASPTEMRDIIEQYVGPMVLKPDGDIERKETAAAETEAALELPPTGDENEPLHAGRVKRSIAGARFASNSRPDHLVVLPFVWGFVGVCDVA